MDDNYRPVLKGSQVLDIFQMRAVGKVQNVLNTTMMFAKVSRYSKDCTLNNYVEVEKKYEDT